MTAHHELLESLAPLDDFAGCLQSALADCRKHDIEYDFYFDADVAAGCLQPQLEFFKQSSRPGDREGQFFRALWSLGGFRTAKILSPHAIELVRKADSLSSETNKSAEYLRDIVTTTGLANVLSDISSTFQNPLLSPEVLTRYIARKVRDFTVDQFIALEAASVPAYESRKKNLKNNIELVTEPRLSLSWITKDQRTWTLATMLSELRNEASVSQNSLADAAALVAAATIGQYNRRGSKKVVFFYTQTRDIRSLCRLRKAQELLGINIDSVVAPGCSLHESYLCVRSSYYMILRLAINDLGFDKSASAPGSQSSIVRVFGKVLEELRVFIESSLRDGIDGDAVKARVGGIRAFMSAVCRRWVTENIWLKPESPAMRSISNRYSEIARSVAHIQTAHKEIVDLLNENEYQFISREAQVMRSMRIEVPFGEIVDSPESALKMESGISRWIGDLPTQEQSRIKEYLGNIAHGGEERSRVRWYIENSLSSPSIENDFRLAAALAWSLRQFPRVKSALEQRHAMREERSITEAMLELVAGVCTDDVPVNDVHLDDLVDATRRTERSGLIRDRIALSWAAVFVGSSLVRDGGGLAIRWREVASDVIRIAQPSSVDDEESDSLLVARTLVEGFAGNASVLVRVAKDLGERSVDASVLFGPLRTFVSAVASSDQGRIAGVRPLVKGCWPEDVMWPTMLRKVLSGSALAP